MVGFPITVGYSHGQHSSRRAIGLPGSPSRGVLWRCRLGPVQVYPRGRVVDADEHTSCRAEHRIQSVLQEYHAISGMLRPNEVELNRGEA